MFDRLDQIEAKYEELNQALSSPEIVNDSARYQKTAKAHSEISELVGKYREYKDLKQGIEDSRAMIAEETAPKRLRLHPTDAVRLQGTHFAVEIVGDPMLAPGTIILDTGSGWVEDGPHVRLEKLRAQLDRLGAPR